MATISYKCPNCGGGLKFDPASQKYACEYCLSAFTQEELDRLEPDEGGEQAAAGGAAKTGDAAAGGQAVVYTCPSCGAEIVTDETTAATFCFYCHNPVVLQGRLGGEYQPDYVLPFSIDREKAKGIFLQWLKQKKFVPKSFYSPDQIEKMTGVYFPYWMYSCEVDGRLEGEGLRERTWVSGKTRYTEHEKYNILRTGHMEVGHVTRNALKKADRKLIESVMPYDMNALKPFSMGYLSGFVAEKRDMEQGEFVREVENEVREYALNDLNSGLAGYSSVQMHTRQADLRDSRWEYALLPVWTLTYRDSAGKIYYFACNGQNGKVCGVLPVDRTKLAVFFAKIFTPLFIILMIAGYFL